MSFYICQRCEAQYETWGGACPACNGIELLKVAKPVDRMVGRLVHGRYRILRQLGQGGMGSVYLAEQEGIGQQVAMKFLNSGLSLDPDVARRFLNEAKSYARVAHPNAVTLHDFGQDEEGTLYISMEYVEGDDLKRVLANVGRLALHEATDIILQVADVLAYAHARQVVHRDLKPENIMVRQGMRGWHVKVLDFGIARICDGATRLTVQGAVAGTPRYMPPEQAMGLDVDSRADIYAVGVVLFELLTGQQPFDGMTVTEIMQKQVNQPMPHLQDVAPDLQLPAIDAVIQKATAKKRVERYATMEAFATDLSNALPTLPHRKHVSGVNPAVKSTAADERPPSTLLYGDGSEATMVRNAAVASGPGQAGPAGTSRMEPIPLTQPAKPDGFDKTGHAASPYAAPKRSRTGMVMGIGMAAVLLAAGAGVVAIRHTGGAHQDVSPAPSTSRQEAAAPEAPKPPTEPGPLAELTVPTEPAQQPELAEPVEPAAAQAVASAGTEGPQRERARELGLETVEPGLVDLGRKLEDATKRLARARGRESEGNCEQAIGLYRALKKDYPHLTEVTQGIKRCQRMLPPEISE